MSELKTQLEDDFKYTLIYTVKWLEGWGTLGCCGCWGEGRPGVGMWVRGLGVAMQSGFLLAIGSWTEVGKVS